MDLRAMSTKRLLGVTARLLAAAALLVAIGQGLVSWTSWRQTGLSLDEQGVSTGGEMPFSAKVAIAVFESSFRPAGLQLTVAAVLVAGAVVALQFHPHRPRIGSQRWEVLAAGSVVLALVLVFVTAHVFVITAPASVDGDVSAYIGLQPMTEAALVNLLPLSASLLTLVVAALWWVRLGRPADGEEPDDDADHEDVDDEDADTEDADMAQVTRDARDDPGTPVGGHVDYSRDWSPEDFRPPR